MTAGADSNSVQWNHTENECRSLIEFAHCLDRTNSASYIASATKHFIRLEWIKRENSFHEAGQKCGDRITKRKQKKKRSSRMGWT